MYMHFDPLVSPHIMLAFMFMGSAGVLGTLIANYRMERSARLGYLLASKEALRLFALNRDREELATISNTDALTGISNRGHFDRRLGALFDGGAALGAEIHLILLDVDFFKRFNDRYGHPGGDACLRAIAAVLTRAVRGKNDFVFRYGGEEFGALLLDASKDQAEKIAERIRASVQDAAIEHLNRECRCRAFGYWGPKHTVLADRTG
jgi:diguanylate cyclase (GGDEF)-like protein